jgi:hypothetical protein
MSDTTDSDEDRGGGGAYGLWIDGVPGAGHWLTPWGGTEAAGRLAVEVTVGAVVAPDRSWCDDERAELALLGGGVLRMTNGEARARFAFAQPPGADELVHPWLAPAAALSHVWAGREVLHGGAFMTPGGAVLLLAGKEAGKSTTLAWLAGPLRRQVLSDDVLVLDGDRLWAGPRCLDLRAGGPAHGLDLSAVTVVRHGDRLRVALSPAPARVAVAGSVVLAWGPRTTLEAIPVSQRPAQLLAHRLFTEQARGDPGTILELAARPMLTLTRPRGDRGLRRATATLLEYFG